MLSSKADPRRRLAFVYDSVIEVGGVGVGAVDDAHLLRFYWLMCVWGVGVVVVVVVVAAEGRHDREMNFSALRPRRKA